MIRIRPKRNLPFVVEGGRKHARTASGRSLSPASAASRCGHGSMLMPWPTRVTYWGVGSHLANIQIRLRSAHHRDRLVYAVKSVIDAPATRVGSSLRHREKLQPEFRPPPGRVIAIAPTDPGCPWVVLYDEEAELPGDQLLALGRELSSFVESPAVAFSLSGDLLFAGLNCSGLMFR